MMHCKCPLPEGSWGTSGRSAWAERNRNFELSTELKFYHTHLHILFRDVALAQEQDMAVLLIFNKPSWLFCNQRLLCYFPKKLLRYCYVVFPKQTFILVSASNLFFFILYIYTKLLSIGKSKFCFSNNGNYICHYIHLYIWDKMKSFSNDVESSICERLLKPEECICSEMRSPMWGRGGSLLFIFWKWDLRVLWKIKSKIGRVFVCDDAFISSVF